jgi:phage terminase small subunit
MSTGGGSSGGRRPTSAFLKLVTGNPGKREIPTTEPLVHGDPAKPTWLTGRGAELWTEVVGFAFWLSFADSYKLAAWCDRQAEFEKPRKRSKWTASDRREHRSLGSELGLDPSSRARMALNDPQAHGRRVQPPPDKTPDGKPDPAQKYIG